MKCLLEYSSFDFKMAGNTRKFNENVIWKEIPPGTDQKELTRLFENGEITDIDTPNSIRLKYASYFMKYSPRVFAVHFRKTKAKCGLMCKYN